MLVIVTLAEKSLRLNSTYNILNINDNGLKKCQCFFLELNFQVIEGKYHGYTW